MRVNKADLPDENEALPDESSIQVLAEIVGCYKLSTIFQQPDEFDDIESLDKFLDNYLNPFCQVFYKKESLHKTKTIYRNNNPIWTVANKHACILHFNLEDMIRSYNDRDDKDNHVVFEIRSKKSNLISVTRNILIGRVSLAPIDILEKYCTEERFEFPLYCETKNAGSIALRFRVATQSDLEFVKVTNTLDAREFSKLEEKKSAEEREMGVQQKFNPNDPFIITEMDESKVLAKDFQNALKGTMFSMFEKSIPKKLIKPHPDPSRPSETRFMTEKQIHKETFQMPSHNWVKAGSGKLGKIYLEVLACDDLPNLDFNVGGIGDITDAFVSIVYEDVLVQTPVIHNELSPRWLPWTQRAFIFNMMHPTSDIYIGVFDFEEGLLGHKPVGRVAVNIANLKKDVVYNLKYDLYPSSNVTNREKRGSVTIRLRIDVPDDRALLLSTLIPKKKIFLNTRKESTYKVARYACDGEYKDDDTFEVKLLQSYIDEILGYVGDLLFKVKDELASIMFWRGHLKIGCIYIPTKSISFYVLGILFFEKPSLAPSILFFALAITMLLSLESRLLHPSPWVRCKAFGVYFWTLILGRPFTTKNSGIIDSFTHVKETEEFEKKEIERREDISKQNALTKELGKELDAFRQQLKKSTIIATNNNSLLMEIGFMKVLLKVQDILGGICRTLRLVKSIYKWHHGIYSFWLTMCFVILGMLFFYVPIFKILLFVGKVLFIILFGPWMKLIEYRFHSKNQEEQERIESKIRSSMKKISKRWREKAEQAEKTKAWRRLKFGKYIVRVPRLNVPRYPDYPVPESYAKPMTMYESILCSKESEDKARFIPGHVLYGVMNQEPKEEKVEDAVKESDNSRKKFLSYMKQQDKLMNSNTKYGSIG